MNSDRNYNSKLAEAVESDFIMRFGEPPALIIRSPGRINLIGEHTDYNDGFVLPSAVSQGIYMAIGPANDCVHNWHALDLDEIVSIGADALGSLREDWSDFIQGAWLSAREHSESLPYINLSFGADLPIGSGMSSSSALTCGILFGMNHMAGLNLPNESIPEMAYNVERGFIGVRGGIMDQYASTLSKPDSFLLLDCLDRTYQHIPKPDGLYLFLIHSRVQRALKTSGYNDRSDECARALTQLKAHVDINSFRDLNIHEFEKYQLDLDEIPYKRIHYVYEENKRLMDTVDALRKNDADKVGKLMYEGHAGLRDEFEVSIPELDLLVDLTQDEDWILGARMMGGGFGGCTINLATREPDHLFIKKVTRAYSDAFDIDPLFIPVSLTGGTTIIKDLYNH